MIVPMKKIAILVQPKDSKGTIRKLRSLGVVHVEHQKLPEGKDLCALEKDLALIKDAGAILSQEEFLKTQERPLPFAPGDWKFTARHILDLHKRYSQLKDYAFTLKDRISQWQAWGDFDPESISSLRSKGLYLRLYRLPVKAIKELNSRVIVKRISVVRGMANCLVISREEVDIPFEEVSLPKMGLAAMRARLSEDAQMMQVIKEEILKATGYRRAFGRIRQSLEEELEFYQALSGMGEDRGLAYLRGYIPYNAVGSLEEAARQESWGIAISEPSEEDAPPTLIRNPRWVSVIKPLFKLIEVIPGYREPDISLWFFIFFSIFAGMLIGDMGIGLVLLALAFFARRKWGAKLKDKAVFVLLYVSCSAAIIWGLFTGTFFGQEWLPAWVSPLIPALRNTRFIQAFCFFLGAIHLSIAHAWRSIIKMPSFSAFAEIGWISILWGAFFLARLLVLGESFPVFGKWLFIIGAIAVVFFTSPSRNLLKSIGQGLANLLLNLVNSFTDIVSYVRLFAVGLATVAVADAFNGMARNIGFDNIVTAIVASLVLLVGHILNMVLAPMSILVHGVRLNVLEFCNHIDVKWRGVAYNPLRKRGRLL